MYVWTIALNLSCMHACVIRIGIGCMYGLFPIAYHAYFFYFPIHHWRHVLVKWVSNEDVKFLRLRSALSRISDVPSWHSDCTFVYDICQTRVSNSTEFLHMSYQLWASIWAFSMAWSLPLGQLLGFHNVIRAVFSLHHRTVFSFCSFHIQLVIAWCFLVLNV